MTRHRIPGTLTDDGAVWGEPRSNGTQTLHRRGIVHVQADEAHTAEQFGWELIEYDWDGAVMIRESRT